MTKATDYTHSPWSGKKYDRPQSQKDLLAESQSVLNRHPTISRALQQRKSFDLDAYYANRSK